MILTLKILELYMKQTSFLPLLLFCSNACQFNCHPEWSGYAIVGTQMVTAAGTPGLYKNQCSCMFLLVFFSLSLSSPSSPATPQIFGFILGIFCRSHATFSL
jgi:hypothetical protein